MIFSIIFPFKIIFPYFWNLWHGFDGLVAPLPLQYLAVAEFLISSVNVLVRSSFIRRDFSRKHGAIAAMYQAAQNGYFNGYDWVFRMNPDVITQDDAWMIEKKFVHNADSR